MQIVTLKTHLYLEVCFIGFDILPQLVNPLREHAPMEHAGGCRQASCLPEQLCQNNEGYQEAASAQRGHARRGPLCGYARGTRPQHGCQN